MTSRLISTLLILASLTPKLQLPSQKSERLNNHRHHTFFLEITTTTHQVCVPTRPLLHAGRPRPLSRRSKPGLRGWAQPEDRGGGGAGTRLPTDPPGSSRTNLRPAVPSAHLRGLPLVLRPRRGSPDCDRQSQNHDPVTGAEIHLCLHR